jgi:putative PIG3 family NAD(P)H quinone oxidoreductase
MSMHMKAVIITRSGGPEVLEVREVEAPVPAANEVLLRVKASALNRADLLQRQGRYPAPSGFPPDIPGIEFAGEVAALGPGASRWKAGQRVFGITGGGAHAEFLVAHEGTLAEIPAKLNWAEAAAVPEAFLTAHDALWEQAGLVAGERVLIHAVGSGVGLAAVQLVRAKSAIPYGTSRTADKIERARKYGLEDGAVVTDPAAELPELTHSWEPEGFPEESPEKSNAGFDVVLDLVGGPYVPASLQAMRLKGRLMLVGTVGGSSAELKFAPLMSKRLTIRGTVLRARSLEEKVAATAKFAAEVVPLLKRGTLRPTIDSRFPLEQVRQAHQRLESNESFGKVVLELA